MNARARNGTFRIVAFVLALSVSMDPLCYGLATLPASQNSIAKREVLAALERAQIRYAESPEELRLLEANGASCLLLSSDSYLVLPELAVDDIGLVRAIFYRDIDAILQIIAREDPDRYREIRQFVSRLFPSQGADVMPTDRRVSYILSTVFSWMALEREGVVTGGDIPSRDRDAIGTVNRALRDTRIHCFGPEFWDARERRLKIRRAAGDGAVFYSTGSRVAEAPEAETPLPFVVERSAYEPLFRNAIQLISARGLLPPEQLRATLARFTVKVESRHFERSKAFFGETTKLADGSALISINRAALDSSSISQRPMTVLVAYFLAREIDKIGYLAFCDDLNMKIARGKYEAIEILREIERLRGDGDRKKSLEGVFFSGMSRLNKTYPLIDYSRDYVELLRSESREYQIDPQGKPSRLLASIKAYINRNSGDGLRFPHDYYMRYVDNLTNDQFFALRRWYRGYYTYWSDAAPERGPEGTDIEFCFNNHTPDKELTAKEEIKRILVGPSDNDTSFLAETIRNLYDEDDFNLTDVKRINVRFLADGSFKEVYYVQVIMRGDYLEPFEFVMLAPRERIIARGGSVHISESEFQRLSRLYRLDSSLVPRPGAHTVRYTFDPDPAHAFSMTRRDIYTVQYAGRDIPKLVELYRLNTASKINTLRNAVSRYIVLWHRLGGYEFICDPSIENVCILDWKASIVDVGAPTYDYDITHILSYFWNTVFLDGNGRSIFEDPHDAVRWQDRRFIFDGVVDAYVLSSKGGKDEAIVKGIHFLERALTYESNEMSQDLKSALAAYIADYKKNPAAFSYVKPQGIEYAPLDQINWDVINEIWGSLEPDQDFSPYYLTYNNFVGVNYMAQSFHLAIRRQKEEGAIPHLEVPPIDFRIRDLSCQQEQAILTHIIRRFYRDSITPDQFTLLFVKSLLAKYKDRGLERYLGMRIKSDKQYLRLLFALRSTITKMADEQVAGGIVPARDAGDDRRPGRARSLERNLFAFSPLAIVVDEAVISAGGGNGMRRARELFRGILEKHRSVTIFSDSLTLAELTDAYAGGIEPALLESLTFVSRADNGWAVWDRGEWHVYKDRARSTTVSAMLKRFIRAGGVPLWNSLVLGTDDDIPRLSILNLAGVAFSGDELQYYGPGGIRLMSERGDGGVWRVLQILHDMPDAAQEEHPYRNVSIKTSNTMIAGTYEEGQKFKSFQRFIDYAVDVILARYEQEGKKKMFVSVSGPQAVGKSTLINGLVAALRQRGVDVVSFAQDDVMLDVSIRDRWYAEGNEKYKNHNEWFDWEKLIAIFRLMAEKVGLVELTGLCDENGKCAATRTLDIHDDTVFIIDGHYQEDPGLYPADMFAVRFHLTDSPKAIFERYFERNREYRPGEAEDTSLSKITNQLTSIGRYLARNSAHINRDCILVNMADFEPSILQYRRFHRDLLMGRRMVPAEEPAAAAEGTLTDLWALPRVQDLARDLARSGLDAFAVPQDIPEVIRDAGVGNKPGNMIEGVYRHPNGLEVIRKRVENAATIKEYLAARDPACCPTFFAKGDTGHVYELNLIPFGYQTLRQASPVLITGGDGENASLITGLLRRIFKRGDKWFIHGHLHHSNILVKRDEAGKIYDVKIFDWKFLRSIDPADKDAVIRALRSGAENAFTGKPIDGRRRVELLDLENEDLSGLSLTSLIVTFAGMESASLRNATFSGVNLGYSIFRNADLRGIRSHDLGFFDCDLSGADFSGARLNGWFNAKRWAKDYAYYLKKKIAGQEPRGAAFWRPTYFERCLLRDAVFRGAHCKRTEFRSSDLRGTVFTGAAMDKTYFRDCDLADADFRGVRGQLEEAFDRPRFRDTAFDTAWGAYFAKRGYTVAYPAGQDHCLVSDAPPAADMFGKEADVRNATVLALDLIHANLRSGFSYEISYDTSRLTASQVAIVEAYAALVKAASPHPERIRLRPASSANGSKESLIAVYCVGKDFEGEGHVDVTVPEGELQDYVLRITGMLNIAFASSSIPSGLSKESFESYRPLLSYIAAQCASILGNAFTMPDSPEDIMVAVRHIVLTLPRSLRLKLEQIEEYNTLAREALTAA